MGLEQFYPGEWPVHDERVKEVAGGAVTSIAETSTTRIGIRCVESL